MPPLLFFCCNTLILRPIKLLALPFAFFPHFIPPTVCQSLLLHLFIYFYFAFATFPQDKTFRTFPFYNFIYFLQNLQEFIYLKGVLARRRKQLEGTSSGSWGIDSLRDSRLRMSFAFQFVSSVVPCLSP